MEVSDDMIKKFLENKCTPEEAARVYAYLLNNKEQLDKWLPEEEWESFESNVKLNFPQSNSWFDQIEARKGDGRMRMMPRKLAAPVAAAVLLALSFLAIYLLVRPTPEKAVVAKNIPLAPANTERVFNNNSLKKRSYTLDDGSTVTLHANSILICNQPFDVTSRRLTLHGEAMFYVARDTARPFVVYTRGFSTTALGTIFRIKAYDSSRTSTVELIEGKVMLQNLHHAEKPMYLHPGDEYDFNYKDNSFHNITPKVRIPVKTIASIQVDGSITESETEISFSNTPLPKVLKRVSELYGIRIDTDSAQLEGRKFTGSFLKKQAGDDVLATIAGLNNYTVAYDGTVYRLTTQ